MRRPPFEGAFSPLCSKIEVFCALSNRVRLIRGPRHSTKEHMASVFFRGSQPNGSWWLRIYNPKIKKPDRFSLKTGDQARAELLRKKIELAFDLAQPEFKAVEIPEEIAAALGIHDSSTPPPPLHQPLQFQPAPKCKPRLKIADALTLYLGHINSENNAHHVEGKISMLRQLLGPELLPYKLAPQGKKEAKGFFTGHFVDELSAEVVLKFLNERELSRKSRRHYREVLHHFYEVLLKHGKIDPFSFHTPNPMASLPSFLDKGGNHIVFLRPSEKAEQAAALGSAPALLAAFKIMSEAGLRRSEALWLRKDAIASDLSFMSVTNQEDPEHDTISSLKTLNSKRSVTILPPLKSFLEKYLATLEGEWLIPSPGGKRWDVDNFSAALRKANNSAKLPWSAMHYRHTYATERAGEGWTTFDLANEMGTSIAMIQSHYAAYVKPSLLTRQA